jgi:hypothetical protein
VEKLINTPIVTAGTTRQLIEEPVTHSIHNTDHIPDFRPRKVNHTRKAANQVRLGFTGEKLVLEYEKRKLIEAGRTEETGEVRHVSYLDGDGAGYDILSFDEEGREKYIEVKTTTMDEQTPFMITDHEVQFSERGSEQYRLYRVYNYDAEHGSGEFYVLRGNMREALKLKAT